MQAQPRIKFGTQYIDFDKVNEIDPVRMENRVRKGMASGKRSVASFYSKEKVEMLLDFEDAQRIINEIGAFYEYVRQGATFELWKDRKVGAYWPLDGNLYSNNRDQMTFARSSAAYFGNPDTGLLESVASGVARFGAGKFGRGLRIQKSRANRITHPSLLTDASWTKGSAVSSVANTSETADPAGGTDAHKIVLTGAPTNAQIYIDTSQAISTDDSSYSCWMKSQTGTCDVLIGILRDDTGATLASDTITVNPTWQRLKVAYESGGSIAANFRALIHPQTTDIIYHYSSQLESGADVLYSTDDIDPTATSAATRAAESIVYPTAGIINNFQGTIIFWIRPQWTYNKHATSTLFYCQGAVASRFMSLDVENNGLMRIVVRDGDGSNRVNATQTMFNVLSPDTWHQIAIKYDVTISNGIKVFVDDTAVITSSNDPFTPNVLGTNFAIGSAATGSDGLDGDIDDIVIYNEVLSDADIQRNFYRGTALALERTYWPALELMMPEFNPTIIRGTRMYSYLLQALEVL